jgi:hypothetical protein
MPDNNTGVLVALIGFGIAAVMIFSGGSAGSSTSSTGATSRDEVLAGFAANQQSLIEQMEEFATQSSGSNSSTSPPSSPDTSANDPGDSSTWEPGFAQQIVERTGYLPDGFDAAGRIAQLNRGNTVGL